MAELTISEVARQIGLQPSAIRYYEGIGLLPPALRRSGQRRYDSTVLHRLAVIRMAQQLGFTLEQIRQLFFGFSPTARASERWHKLSQRKLEELDALMDDLKTMRALLKKMVRRCHCDTLDQCGKGIFHSRDGKETRSARSALGNAITDLTPDSCGNSRGRMSAFATARRSSR